MSARDLLVGTAANFYWQCQMYKNRLSTALSGGPKSLTPEQRQHWDEKGFLVLPGFFTPQQTRAVLDVVENQWTRSRNEKLRTVIDVFIGTEREKRIRLTDAPDEARKLPFKINDLYLENDTVRNMALDPRLSAILADLLAGRPLCCNSLNFEYGSQQAFHTDSLYMTPPRKLNLAASWTALEDCHPDSGPLAYYPGSHLIPPYRFSTGEITAVPAEMDKYKEYMAREVEKRGLKQEVFCAKNGDVFIWHSQLFHGGTAIKDMKRTRKSLVVHYFLVGDRPWKTRRVNEWGYFMDRAPHAVKE